MNLTNYHSHCNYCDGRAPLEDFIQEAIRQGFTSYGISSHAPLPFSTRWNMERDQLEAYLEECRCLKQKYSGQIELYIGLEIDYLNEETHPAIPLFRSLPLDYRIGSLHMLYDDKGNIVDVDVSADKFRILVEEHFQGDLEIVIRQYYRSLTRMVELGGFDIVGHIDKIHYNASSYTTGVCQEKWYQQLIRDFLHLIVQKGYMVEVNTKAYERLGVFYPSQYTFSLLHELDIPIVVNSDAHHPDLINSGREEALTALYKAGILTVMELHQGTWKAVSIRLN